MNQTKIKLVQSTKLYKLIITNNLERQIRLLCNKFKTVEWSGILFYDYSGSFKEDNLVLTTRDLYLMDIGTSTYTEFKMSSDVISYMTENDLLDSQMGLIHSHNTMNAFFSGEDQNTLKLEGTDRNNFLSLIVNNAGDYNAAITRNIKIKTASHTESNYEFFDKGINNTIKDDVVNKNIIEYFNLKIKKPNLFPNKLLENRIKEVKENSKKNLSKEGVKKQSALPLVYNGYNRIVNSNDDELYPKEYNYKKTAAQLVNSLLHLPVYTDEEDYLNKIEETLNELDYMETEYTEEDKYSVYSNMIDILYSIPKTKFNEICIEYINKILNNSDVYTSTTGCYYPED